VTEAIDVGKLVWVIVDGSKARDSASHVEALGTYISGHGAGLICRPHIGDEIWVHEGSGNGGAGVKNDVVG
jgi:hypothetical protein